MQKEKKGKNRWIKKGKRKQTGQMERKIDCNLLYNIKERKSGAKPEGIRKSKRLYCIAQKCIRKSLGFPAIRTGWGEESSTVQTLVL